MSLEVCNVHGVQWKTIPAGVSKKTGKPYNSFQTCPVIGCTEKPPKVGESEWVNPQAAMGVGMPPRADTEVNLETKPDWDGIARGKVRNSIAVAFIQTLGPILGTKDLALTDDLINEMEPWVEWVMNGGEN